jgi:hypothetical protein
LNWANVSVIEGERETAVFEADSTMLHVRRSGAGPERFRGASSPVDHADFVFDLGSRDAMQSAWGTALVEIFHVGTEATVEARRAAPLPVTI